MKLKHSLLGLAVASVMLAPAAFAQSSPKFGQPFAVSLTSSAPMATPDSVRYPAGPGMKGLEGGCDVAFDVSASGEPANVRAIACTSPAFRRSAEQLVNDMSFKAAAVSDARLSVRWNFRKATDALTTASLN